MKRGYLSKRRDLVVSGYEKRSDCNQRRRHTERADRTRNISDPTLTSGAGDSIYVAHFGVLFLKADKKTYAYDSCETVYYAKP